MWYSVKSKSVSRICMGVLAAIIYVIFGLRILSTIFLMVCCLSTAFGMWYMLNGFVNFLLQKRKKSYNAHVVSILAVIPSLAFLGLCVCVRGYLSTMVNHPVVVSP